LAASIEAVSSSTHAVSWDAGLVEAGRFTPRGSADSPSRKWPKPRRTHDDREKLLTSSTAGSDLSAVSRMIGV
jgi:hypothetical protein